MTRTAPPTFSGAKSVSILFGVGDASTQGKIRTAHERTVAAALAYAPLL